MKKILLTYLLGIVAMIVSSFVIKGSVYSAFRVFTIILMIASIESVRTDFRENWFSTLFMVIIGLIILISGILTNNSSMNLFVPMILLLLISTFKTLKNIWDI